ncbi:MAG: glycosyltransferase family 4 protein [Acidobacteria bacterium]|nr:glycosyltransferase family 4 protein [Acidobacteriota bacterium]
MRIVVDYRPALRQRSGVGEYIHRLVNAFAAGPGKHHDIVLFSSSLKHQVDPAALAGVRVANRRVPVRVLNRLWHRLGWPPVEMLVRGPFDVAHSPHPLMLPTRSAARVVTIHDLDFLTHPERTRGEVQRDYPRLVRQHAQRADHIVVISAYTAGEVHQQLDVPHASLTVCRPGAPDWKPRASVPEEGPILFVGTLEPRKNVGGLLDGYARLLEGGEPAPDLVLVGARTSAAKPWLDRLARPPLAGRVQYLGYVSETERRRLFEAARLLVLPSYDEGFGLPVLEAMTVGVPVVASGRGALPEVLGDAGLLVEPDDADGLASAMARLLFDREAATRAAARGIRRSIGFDWRATAEALRSAYEHAMALKRRRDMAFSRLP